MAPTIQVNRLKGTGSTSEMLLFPQFCPPYIPASNVLPVGLGQLLALAHLPAEANFLFFSPHLLFDEPSPCLSPGIAVRRCWGVSKPHF